MEPPDRLRRVLTDAKRSDTKPLTVTFGINDFWHRIDPSGRIMGHDCFHNWPETTDRPCFSWVETLGYLEIFYWYDLEWEDGYPFGGEPMWASPAMRLTRTQISGAAPSLFATPWRHAMATN